MSERATKCGQLRGAVFLAALALSIGVSNNAVATRADIDLMQKSPTLDLRTHEIANTPATKEWREDNEKKDTRPTIVEQILNFMSPPAPSKPKDIFADYDLTAKSPDAAKNAVKALRAHHKAVNRNLEGAPLILTTQQSYYGEADKNDPIVVLFDKDEQVYAYYDRVYDITIWVTCETERCKDALFLDLDAYASIGGQALAGRVDVIPPLYRSGGVDPLPDLYRYGNGLDNIKKSYGILALRKDSLDREGLRIIAKGAAKICEPVIVPSQLAVLTHIYKDYMPVEEVEGELIAARYLASGDLAQLGKPRSFEKIASGLMNQSLDCLTAISRASQKALDAIKHTDTTEYFRVCKDTNRALDAAQYWRSRKPAPGSLPGPLLCPDGRPDNDNQPIAQNSPNPGPVPPGGNSMGPVAPNVGPGPTPPPVGPAARVAQKPPEVSSLGDSAKTATVSQTQNPPATPSTITSRDWGDAAPGDKSSPATQPTSPQNPHPAQTPTPAIRAQTPAVQPPTMAVQNPIPAAPEVAVPTAELPAVQAQTATIATRQPIADTPSAKTDMPAADNASGHSDTPATTPSGSTKLADANPAANSLTNTDPAQAAITRYTNDIKQNNVGQFSQDRANLQQALQASGQPQQKINDTLAQFDRMTNTRVDTPGNQMVTNTGPQTTPADTRGPPIETAKLPSGGQTPPATTDAPQDQTQKIANNPIADKGGGTSNGDAGGNSPNANGSKGSATSTNGDARGGSDVTKGDGGTLPNGNANGGSDIVKGDGGTPRNGDAKGGSDVAKTDSTTPPNGNAQGGSDVAKSDGNAPPSDPAGKSSTVANTTSADTNHSLTGIKPLDSSDPTGPGHIGDEPTADNAQRNTQLASKEVSGTDQQPGGTSRSQPQPAGTPDRAGIPGTDDSHLFIGKPDDDVNLFTGKPDKAVKTPVAMLDGRIYSCDQSIGADGPIQCRAMSADGKKCTAGVLVGPSWTSEPDAKNTTDCSASDIAARKTFLDEKVAAMPEGCQSDYRTYLDDVISNATGEKPVGAGIGDDAATINEIKKLPTTADFIKLMKNKPCADALTQIAARNFVDAPSLADQVQDDFKNALTGTSTPSLANARQAAPLTLQPNNPRPVSYSDDDGDGGGGGGLDTAISILNLGTSILGLAATLSGHGGGIPSFTNIIPSGPTRASQPTGNNCFLTHMNNPKACITSPQSDITGTK